MPRIRKLRTGVYVGAGYSGQGVTIAPLAGKLLADALTNAPGRLDDYASIPTPAVSGRQMASHADTHRGHDLVRVTG